MQTQRLLYSESKRNRSSFSINKENNLKMFNNDEGLMMVLNDDRIKPIGKTNNTSVGLRYDYDNNVRLSMGRTSSSNSYNNTSKTLAN